jgi:hypothetical protein
MLPAARARFGRHRQLDADRGRGRLASGAGSLTDAGRISWHSVADPGPAHPAQALTVFFRSGPSKDYVRVEQDGHTRWQEAKTTFGQGPPYEPWPDGRKRTPAEMAEYLAAVLE